MDEMTAVDSSSASGSKLKRNSWRQGSWGEGTLHDLGDERRSHGAERGKEVEQAGNLGAERTGDSRLAAFDLDEWKLRQMRKSADESLVIVALFRAETVVRAGWAAEKLQMEIESSTTRASKGIEQFWVEDRRAKRILATISSSPFPC